MSKSKCLISASTLLILTSSPKLPIYVSIVQVKTWETFSILLSPFPSPLPQIKPSGNPVVSILKNYLKSKPFSLVSFRAPLFLNWIIVITFTGHAGFHSNPSFIYSPHNCHSEPHKTEVMPLPQTSPFSHLTQNKIKSLYHELHVLP